MDITEPLTSLKSLLEQRLAVSLHDYAFFLQDTQEVWSLALNILTLPIVWVTYSTLFELFHNFNSNSIHLIV